MKYMVVLALMLSANLASAETKCGKLQKGFFTFSLWADDDWQFYSLGFIGGDIQAQLEALKDQSVCIKGYVDQDQKIIVVSKVREN